MDVIATAQRLIRIESETSHCNARVAAEMVGLLKELDFAVEELPYNDLHGLKKVALAAKRGPLGKAKSGPGIGYFCHNDVVSVAGWDCPHSGPWDAVVSQGRLWGRGSCDMKGSAAAALAATSRIAQASQTAPIYFFATGDEESGMAGAEVLATQSQFFGDLVQNAGVGIIGEPTEMQLVNAHKGGCHIEVTSHGVAAHSSTSDGRNANWDLIPFLSYIHSVAERCQTEAPLMNDAFNPPTMSLNVVIENEPAMSNITVGRATCRLFLRPMPDTAWQPLVDEIVAHATRLELGVTALRPLLPLHTPRERPFVKQVLGLLGQSHTHAVCYATDGCCFQDLPDLLVLGPGSIEQAHRPNEWISIEQLQLGSTTYEKLFRRFACNV